jgi:hypothetical protein
MSSFSRSGLRPGFRSAFVRAATAIACALLSALAPRAALAGAARPCSEPAVFQGAAVNSFVLPYRYVGNRRTAELEMASRQISALVHLDLLFSMLKYGAVGGTDLLAEGGRTCDVDDVIAQVTLGGGPGALLTGRTLVVVWGRLYEEGDQLYLQSYARFLRQGDQRPAPETIAVQLTGDGVELPLRAALPAQSIAFPPRRISKADLAQVAVEFRKAMVVRSNTSSELPGQSIDFEPGRSFPYYVTKTARTKEGNQTVDWMWIEPMTDGPKGWVRARVGDTAEKWSLQRWLPELAYVDALHGFMRLRARGAGGLDGERVQRIRAWIDAGFARFEGAVRVNEGPSAYGLARAVRGFVTWDLQPKERAAAAALFAEARALMPQYAAARNLAAVTRPLAGDAPLDKAALDRLHRELVGAIALDPRDAFALGNLDQLYRTLNARPALSMLKSQDIEQRLAIVKAARAKAVEMR